MITDPSVIKFSNEHSRPFCDKIGSSYFEAKKLLNIYESKGIENVILSDPSGYIDDGSAIDGRSQLIGQDIYAIKQIALWIVTNSESDDNYTVNMVLKAAVNPE